MPIRSLAEVGEVEEEEEEKRRGRERRRRRRKRKNIFFLGAELILLPVKQLILTQ